MSTANARGSGTAIVASTFAVGPVFANRNTSGFEEPTQKVVISQRATYRSPSFTPPLRSIASDCTVSPASAMLSM